MLDWIASQPSTSCQNDGNAYSDVQGGRNTAIQHLRQYALQHSLRVGLDVNQTIFTSLADVEVTALRWKRRRGYLKSKLVHAESALYPTVLVGNSGSSWKVSSIYALELLTESKMLCEKSEGFQMCGKTHTCEANS